MKLSVNDRVDIVFSHGVDLAKRRIYLVHGDDDTPGVVGPALAALAIQGLRTLDDDEGEIEIIFNSMGGCEYAGLAIYDAIKQTRNRIVITVYGCAMSMAAFILQAADERTLSPHATVMAHFGTTSLTTSSPNLPRLSKETERMSAIYRDVLLSRIQEKKPDMSAKKLSKLLLTDWYLDAHKAVEWGLADRVL